MKNLQEKLVPFTENTLPLNKLRANSHIIWDKEGQYFAAIITKADPKKKGSLSEIWFVQVKSIILCGDIILQQKSANQRRLSLLFQCQSFRVLAQAEVMIFTEYP